MTKYESARRKQRRATRRLALYLSGWTRLWDTFGSEACEVLDHDHVLQLARRIAQANRIILDDPRRNR